MLDAGMRSRSSDERPSGGGSGGNRLPPDDQLFDYSHAKGAAADRIAALLNPERPTGKLDVYTTRWLMRAHDLAELLGDASVNCIHLVTAIASDPISQAEHVREAILRELPKFDPRAVLKASSSHLLEQPKLVLEQRPEFVETGPHLKEWIDAARKLTEGRTPQARYVEPKHLLAAAKASQLKEVQDAWRLLNSEPVKTIEALIVEKSEGLTNHVTDRTTSIMESITGAIGALSGRLSQHEQASAERDLRTQHLFSTVQGAIDARANQIDDGIRRLSNSVSGVGSTVDAHRRETAGGFLTVTTEHAAHNAQQTELDTLAEKIDRTTLETNATATRLDDARLKNWLVAVCITLATLAGSAGGFLLRP